MSNGRHFRRRRVKPGTAAMDRVTRLSSAARGCTCNPDVETRHTSYGAERTVRHDGWCPAVDTGTAYAVMRGLHQSAEDFAAAVVDVARIVEDAPDP